ncbi:hypothetical protein [Candidatus Berkiella aquae]|uniref:Uncharacterized protein n=1 Tax=Candidatus Berkiella aquae TaxID=295108 RepID=A0A0Q9Z1N7_9GAMM|nr:hypothetical protein [Candidatus Berkiella aquae]MCS5712163.1 hypothetical protein [Candidatus Berkiella aquae]
MHLGPYDKRKQETEDEIKELKEKKLVTNAKTSLKAQETKKQIAEKAKAKKEKQQAKAKKRKEMLINASDFQHHNDHSNIEENESTIKRAAITVEHTMKIEKEKLAREMKALQKDKHVSKGIQHHHSDGSRKRKRDQ